MVCLVCGGGTSLDTRGWFCLSLHTAGMYGCICVRSATCSLCQAASCGWLLCGIVVKGKNVLGLCFCRKKSKGPHIYICVLVGGGCCFLAPRDL